jgi:hypothetical protein
MVIIVVVVEMVVKWKIVSPAMIVILVAKKDIRVVVCGHTWLWDRHESWFLSIRMSLAYGNQDSKSCEN